MESLEELKAIIDNAPEGASHYDGKTYFRFEMYEHGQAYLILKGSFWDRGLPAYPVYSCRSLSDIERIIELEEKLNNSETKKEECSHPMTTASYDHVTCDSCHMIRTDGGWGCASRRWFDNVQSAKFYEKNGFLPR